MARVHGCLREQTFGLVQYNCRALYAVQGRKPARRYLCASVSDARPEAERTRQTKTAVLVVNYRAFNGEEASWAGSDTAYRAVMLDGVEHPPMPASDLHVLKRPNEANSSLVLHVMG